MISYIFTYDGIMIDSKFKTTEWKTEIGVFLAMELSLPISAWYSENMAVQHIYAVDAESALVEYGICFLESDILFGDYFAHFIDEESMVKFRIKHL